MLERERKREQEMPIFVLSSTVSVNLYKVNMNAEKNYKYAF